jgi:hypothetical protein
MRERKFAAAKDLAEAVRDAAGKFPQGVDLSQHLQAAEKLLRELPAAEATTPREQLPPPEPAAREVPRTPSGVRQALAKKLDMEWRDAPLAQVLQDLAKETGLNIAIDPDLQAGRVFETRRVYMQAHGSSAERVLRTVTDLTLSAYVLADGEVQILPKHKAALYTVARSREVPELGLRSAIDRPLPPARRVAPLLPGEIEKLPPAAPSQSLDYLQSGKALRAEIERLLKSAKPDEEEP